MRKSEAALLLESRIGQRFDALVTGATSDGVWVRLLAPPAEGKVVRTRATLFMVRPGPNDYVIKELIPDMELDAEAAL